MAYVIAVANQKGGVGKTTTAVSLGACLAELGKFVLLVDMDPQANATTGLGIDSGSVPQSMYEVLTGTAQFRDIIRDTAHVGYRVAPAAPALAGATVDLVPLPDRERRFADALLEVRNDYDFILIDCPPSLGLLTVNAFVGADAILIPVQAEYYALEGLGQLMRTIELIRENLKPNLEILGAVITMFDSRYRLSKDVMEELYRYFPNRVFRSVVPRNVRLAEAPSHGKTILAYDADSRGARAYERLAREVLEATSQRLA